MVDIGASPFEMTDKHQMSLDFMSCISTVELTYVSQKASPVKISFNVLFLPFQYPVWTWVVTSLAVTLFTLKGFGADSWFQAFILTMSMVVGQSLPGKQIERARSVSKIIESLLYLWFLMSCLLFFAYGSNLLVVLTTLRLVPAQKQENILLLFMKVS